MSIIGLTITNARRMTKYEFETAREGNWRIGDYSLGEYNPETAPPCLDLSDGSVLVGTNFWHIDKREVVSV